MKSAANPSPDLVPIDELDQAIVDLSARINAATYELLVLIREFEDRAGYLKWGLKDTAEWLSYRCDFGRSAAYEKVRVARALRTLPAISESFSTGELSYSKARALTRVAGSHNEQELLDFAVRTTAVRVEERWIRREMTTSWKRQSSQAKAGRRSKPMRSSISSTAIFQTAIAKSRVHPTITW